MISLKPGVRIIGMRPEVALAVSIAASVFERHGFPCVITSVTEGQHSVGSKHYAGLAFDLRMSQVAETLRTAVVSDIKAALGEDFDVILEGAGTPNLHCHVEYEPKAPY